MLFETDLDRHLRSWIRGEEAATTDGQVRHRREGRPGVNLDSIHFLWSSQHQYLAAKARAASGSCIYYGKQSCALSVFRLGGTSLYLCLRAVLLHELTTTNWVVLLEITCCERTCVGGTLSPRVRRRYFACQLDDREAAFALRPQSNSSDTQSHPNLVKFRTTVLTFDLTTLDTPLVRCGVKLGDVVHDL
jgi:hypothetical protein